MTPYEYACYLSGLLGDDPPEPNADIFDLRDCYYGLFQAFMPHGDGAEKIFLPLDKGGELWQRLRPVYQTTAPRTLAALAEGCIPGYFAPEAHGEPAQLITIACQLLENFRRLAGHIADDTLRNLLRPVTRTAVCAEPPPRSAQDEELYDRLADWRIANTDYNSPLAVLGEAYYAVNCDYWLSAYLQYPAFTQKADADLLAPYFQLWQHGRKFTLQNNTLIIY